MTQRKSDLTERTIRDFGEEWTKYQRPYEGWARDQQFLDDIAAPFLDKADLRGAVVGEIGSGTGPLVEPLFSCGVAHMVALEPSDAFHVLRRNADKHSANMTFIHDVGERFPDTPKLDYIFSIGVIHHIPDPSPTLIAARRALRPGGLMLIWVYGKEGNELYLSMVHRLRKFTTVFPHGVLSALCWCLVPPLYVYIRLSQRFPLPMRHYARNVLARLNARQLHILIYDQLNPAYAKYYTREEIVALMQQAGFSRVEARHRHSYSWTVAGVAP